jgi:CRISPR/Cas system-associated exonuclease Cas4 (RecB family)
MFESPFPLPPTLNPQYTYPTLERVTKADGDRHYVTPEGEKLKSVTTILSATANKEYLKLWEEWVGTKKANAVREEAAALGTLMHENLEAYLEDRERPRGNNLIRTMARRMADVIIHKGFPKVDEIWGIESPLYFPGLYAGTTDLVGVYEGEPAIMDYKTAKKIRKRDQIGDYFCQGAAYALAHNYHHNTDIRKIVIFMVSRDLSFETFVVKGDEFSQKCDEWQDRIRQYESTQVAA